MKLPCGEELSASKIALAEACPGSHVLPWVKDKPSPSAKRGTRIHEYLEHVFSMWPIHWERLDIPPSVAKLCQKIDTNSIVEDLHDVRTEYSVALNMKTGCARVLGQHLGRNYDVGEDEIAGTIDLLAKHNSTGHPVVVDFKTGKNIGAVGQLWQMRFLCVVVARLFFASRVEARIVYLDWYGEITTASHTFTLMELDMYEADLQAIVAAITPQAETIPGDHCDGNWCPARANCNEYALYQLRGKSA